VVYGTDGVVKVFGSEALWVQGMRNWGLMVLDHWPGAKRRLARQAMGLPWS
jgi:2-polyprenyl-6-methoxyphenol hydroxylase-like FAD-dependent oxidoreductase